MKRLVFASVAIAGLVASAVGGAFALERCAVPPAATSAEGAYLALTMALAEGHPERVYELLDAAGREACAALVRGSARAVALIDEAYPEAERAAARAPYVEAAAAPDAAAFWLARARARGWLAALGADLSGVERVEPSAEGAVVVTARGSRVELARDADGRFGLARHSAELVAESERLRRDLARIEVAAEDYRRAGR